MHPDEQRRGTIRSAHGGGRSRRPSSAVDHKYPSMDRSCAIILMYCIYFCYVLACFGAMLAVAGLMLRISSEQPGAHDKGKIIAGTGIGICAVCFVLAFYCRSVRLDEQIMETIKETTDDREWSVFKNPKAGWWHMRYGMADQSSIRSIQCNVRPDSAASTSSVVVYYQTKPVESTPSESSPTHRSRDSAL
ncbi:uncharacterized protein LOC121046500 [Ixodes scapularis]|uniref:Uncharacterized protein n=1 Tax=Ixodes scapularis TaxID=6945 RepID=B7QAV4_IXOSC|nr:uncharacterized protein LOC121046500 [Ixodes scapularis]EEC15976.1 hypothetical protein IscW_ISCW022008 [Ixodes scapularis]|eukprot:XP_002412680.1 hypothetical protein IscW_ISCW022008 [Ixodes scapularis]